MKNYHRGTRLFIYLSDEGVRNLAALPGATKKARVEWALANAGESVPFVEQARQCDEETGVEALRILSRRAKQEYWNVR